MISQAIVTVSLAEDIFCHMTCKCTQIDESHANMTVKHYNKVEESRYDHFAKMMMLMKDNEKEIVNKVFRERGDEDELIFILDNLIVTYYKDIQPQEWT